MKAPSTGEIMSLDHAYERCLFAYNTVLGASCKSGDKIRVWNKLLRTSLRQFDEVFESQTSITPHVLTDDINEGTFALSGLQLNASYVVRYIEHPTDTELDCNDVDDRPQRINLLYGFLTPRTFQLEPDDNSNEVNLVSDIYIAGIDFESIIETPKRPTLCYVPLENLVVLNRVLPIL